MIEDTSLLAGAFAVTVILTNIITQVIKGATWDKIPTRVVALITAEALSVAEAVIYCTATGVTERWQYILAVAGAVVGGFVAAYAAMYGYDNLYGELAEAVKKLLHSGDAE